MMYYDFELFLKVRSELSLQTKNSFSPHSRCSTFLSDECITVGMPFGILCRCEVRQTVCAKCTLLFGFSNTFTIPANVWIISCHVLREPFVLTSSAKYISSFGLFETPKLPKLLRQLVQHNMLHNSYVAKFSKLKSGWAWRVKKTLFPKILYPPSQIPNFWWYDTTYFYKATCFGV